MMLVRTRFAPSPTGDLHIGGVRTALFNWLYARHHNGKFILRIEDTDDKRSSDESVNLILESLKWLNIDFDEEVYYQSNRKGLYDSLIDKLLLNKKAYRCVCTPAELDLKREQAKAAGKKPQYDRLCRNKDYPADIDKPYTVRIKVPLEGATIYTDLLRGEVKVENAQLDDMIIRRSNGLSAYNFAVVADDADMEITDVIRGDDHIANSPKQVILYDALDLPKPRFAHVSMIIGPDGKRLSKRDGALSVLEYRKNGILPDAFINYVARLGWGSGDREYIEPSEIIKLFTLDSLSLAPARYDETKLHWLNSEYIKNYPLDELTKIVADQLASESIKVDHSFLMKILPPLQVRAKKVTELVDNAKYFIDSSFTYDPVGVKKFFTDSSRSHLENIIDRLENSLEFTPDSIEEVITKFLQDSSLKLKEIAQPVRLALTGRVVSCGIYDIMAILGKDESINRLKRAVNFIGNK